MLMEISDSFLFNKSPQTHTHSHSPITRSSPGSTATSASGSIFRLSLDACQHMQEHWVDTSASLTHTQMLSSKVDHNCFYTTRNNNTLQVWEDRTVLGGIWQEEKNSCWEKKILKVTGSNGRGSSEERKIKSKRTLSSFTLCLWTPVWYSMCVRDQGSRLSFPGLFSCCQLKVSELECELRVPFAACSRLFCRPFAAVQCFARRNPVGRLKQGLLGNGLARVLEMTNGAAKTHTHTPQWS